MRVLNEIGNLSIGGAETYISRVARAMSRYGVDIEICALGRSEACWQSWRMAA
jgi:hypothetical protein